MKKVSIYKFAILNSAKNKQTKKLVEFYGKLKEVYEIDVFYKEMYDRSGHT